MKMSRPVFIVGGKRTPFAKSWTHFSRVTTNDLMVASLKELVSAFSLQGKKVGDAALGALMNSASNWNLARECVLSTDLSPCTPAYNLQRACGTSLEATLQISLKIGAGIIENGIAGGVDTNSDIPVEVSSRLRDSLLAFSQARSVADKLKVLSSLGLNLGDLKPKTPAVAEPRTGKSMGEHAELMVKEWEISRAAQDELALVSHRNADRAYASGFYKDLVVPFMGHSKDTLVRGDTSLEKLSSLKPAFDKANGTITAGNASPLTDGSACVLLSSEDSLKQNSWQPLARLTDAHQSAVDFVGGDGLLMAPTVAVGALLARNGIKLQDFDYYEIHEAFAGQVLCTLKAWESDAYCKKYLKTDRALGSIDRSKMNIHGGSVALGHPFAATGARIVATLAKTISQRKGRGLISICTAGGMGVAAILDPA